MKKKTFGECSSGLEIYQRPVLQAHMVWWSAEIHAGNTEIFVNSEISNLALTFLAINLKISPESCHLSRCERNSGFSFLVEIQILFFFLV